MTQSLRKNTLFLSITRFFEERINNCSLYFCLNCSASCADIFLGKDIKVNFVPALSEFERHPVAHTCSGVLDLPENYPSYLEMRGELVSILKSSEWEMNFV